jgi:hypothetical protein
MSISEEEYIGRIEALGRQRGLALDEAVFHAGRVRALQAELAMVKKTVESLLLRISDLQSQLPEQIEIPMEEQPKE